MNLTLYSDVEFDRWLSQNWDREDITDQEREKLVYELVTRQMASADKVSNMLKFVKHLDGFTDNCEKEEARIERNKASAKNLIGKLKQGIRDYMILKKISKMDAGTFKISLKGGKSVEILDEKLVPSEFKTVEVKVSKSKIKDAIKQGKTVAGAALKGRKFLQIR